jgi:RND family efflux transporter MFP subunit
MAAPVDMITLAEKPVEQASEYVGTLKSRRSNTVQSQVEGFLLKINVKSGDRVAPGTVMFEIDASSQQSAIASLESIRAARESDASFARQQAERAKQLLKVGAMSQQEHDQAQAQLKAAEAQLKAIDEQIKQQRNEWSYSRGHAATAGVVGDIPVRVGDRITRATPLTTLEDNSGLELNLPVPVQEAPRLKLGLPVELLDETGKAIGMERIAFISPSVDDAMQTVLVKTPSAVPVCAPISSFAPGSCGATAPGPDRPGRRRLPHQRSVLRVCRGARQRRARRKAAADCRRPNDRQ